MEATTGAFAPNGGEAMCSISNSKTQSHGVELVEGYGHWLVRVVEEGRETRVADFEVEDYAISFAEGQRMRLGLKDFKRC
ncbi:hypothetical protein [Mesorhizobium sp. CN2-181]|uniref:hypothetical protein n=1 Tax=Mesorhizobium yinganensis TaxID=3157707 RepID=UPI0032B736BD